MRLKYCSLLQTLATGVVQLYLADPPDRTRWSKRCCGVACFIKDGNKRSFYIRVYDIKVWMDMDILEQSMRSAGMQ